MRRARTQLCSHMNGNPEVAIISSASEFAAHPILLALLAEYGFRSAVEPNGRGVCGSIVIERAAAAVAVPSELECKPSCRIVICDSRSPSQQVSFSPAASTPLPFRGRRITTNSGLPPPADLGAATVIADSDGIPLWTTTSTHEQRHDTAYVAAPWIAGSHCVFEQLNAKTLLNVLPLVEWLRALSGWHYWIQPPMRACFMFDDPNLHAKSFGYVRFADIAARAAKHNYHCSFATIPLDGYYVSSGAARIFQRNLGRISLLVHGNNHTFRELGNPGSTEYNRAQMGQAIQRISKLERRTGIHVSRVMAPPHGLCASAMMSAMSLAGFEAVCVSHGSVRAANPGAAWVTQLGAASVPVIEGLPVIPRFALQGCTLEQVLLSAYMNQPIITVGHHWDLADGLDVLAEAARVINTLGPVHWADMDAIARAGYRQRLKGSTLEIVSQARKFRVKIPDKVTEVVLRSPELAQSDEIQYVEACTSRGTLRLPPSASDLRFDVAPEETIEFSLIPLQSASPAHMAGFSARALGRRILGECRDRAMPLLPRGALKRV